MDIDLLRAELERLFELEEMVELSRDVLGFDPEAVGGTAGKGSFARALSEHCAGHDAIEALCDAVAATKSDVRPELLALGLRGLPPEDEIPLGDRFGAFLIARKIGEGPAGITYVARTDTGDVRLKVLRREASRDERALLRFLTLTRLVARVHHVGLPFRLRAGTIDGRHYVSHEAVDAQSLASRIARTGPMHLNEAGEMLLQALDTLAELHTNRIVHGNLKLENVLLYRSADGVPRTLLVDACGDRLRTRPPANGHVELWSVSSPKTVAPEQLRGHAPTAVSDVYSLGAMVFEVLTGQPLYPARTIADAMVGHLSEKPRSPSTVAPRGWVTPQVDEFVLSLLAKDPAARPRTVAEVKDNLERLLRPGTPEIAAPSMSDEEFTARVDALIANPESEEAALALESAAGTGIDAARIAEALVVAADLVDVTVEPEKLNAKKGLLFRAGRLYQAAGKDGDGAEQVYTSIVELDPTEATAQARLDDIRKKLGKYEELVESLLERVERATDGPERAAVLARIGGLYASELGDPEQALVAITQAFTEDPTNPEYASEVERVAGSSGAAWGEVLAACNEASTAERPPEVKNALFAHMAGWYRDRYSRPDLALSCYQAILSTEPSSEAALDGLTGLYRKAQQWQELGMLLLRRAEVATDPSKARDLRCEAAEILEDRLADPSGARDLYRDVLAIDPGHKKASDALVRLLEKTRDYEGMVRLLEGQAAALRGEDRLRALSRIAEVFEDGVGDDAEAIRRYELVLDEDKAFPDALRGLDRLYSKAGRFGALLENLGQQIQVATTPRQKMALWERVASIHDEEFLDHGRAAYALEQVLELDPEHGPSLSGLVRHYRALSRWEDLASLYERLLAVTHDPAQKLEIALARARVAATELSSTERAIGAYEDVLLLDPHHAVALEALAKLRESAGHEDAALSAIDTLAEKAETLEARAELLVRAAKLLEGRGDLEAAISRLRRALDASPKDPAIAAALRTAYVSQGDVNAATALLEREIEATSGDLQKAKLLTDLAELCRAKLSDDARAEAAARRALDHDPTNTSAIGLLADVAFEGGRFVEAAASYEKLVLRVENLERTLAVHALSRYVDALAKGGSTEKALSAMETLLKLAPDDLQAVLRAAAVTFEHGDPARARELYDDLLGRFGITLPESDKALATYRAGEAARRAGALDAAIFSLEAAADLDPSNPEPLVALASAYEAKGDFAKVVDAKTRHLDLAAGDVRVRLLVEIGDLAANKLSDRTLATKSLVAALDERPDDRKLLARLMQLYSEDKDWQKLVDVVVKLADFVDDPKQKTKYLHTAAMVTFREMRDYDLALDYYGKVLRLDPENHKAVDEAIELCEERGDQTGAIERLKEKAKIASDVRDTARMLEAFNKLAALYKELGRIGHAIDAHEAAQTLEPENADRNKILADLYASNPGRYLDKAVAAQMSMLRRNPYRVESYKLLRHLYTQAQRADPAWCLCQALYVLKLSDAEEERFFRRMRSEDPAYAQKTMTGDEWLELVFHADADPMLTSLFAVIEPAVAATRSNTLESLGYHPAYAVDPAHHPYPLSQTLHYAGGVLGMELPPIFENPNDPGGLGFLPATDAAILLGAAALSANASPQALAFLAGRHLAFYRPGFYVRQLVQSGTGLRSWLFAAIKMNAPQFPVAPDIEGAVRESVAALEQHLPRELREQLSRIVSKLIQSGAALDLKRWVQGVDLTADRAGFLLCHDLETAVEIIRASDEGASALASQTRLKDLVLYAISEPYFELRKRLTIGIDV